MILFSPGKGRRQESGEGRFRQQEGGEGEEGGEGWEEGGRHERCEGGAEEEGGAEKGEGQVCGPRDRVEGEEGRREKEVKLGFLSKNKSTAGFTTYIICM